MLILMQTEKKLVNAFKAEGFGTDINQALTFAKQGMFNPKAERALKRIYKEQIIGNIKLTKKYNDILEENAKKDQFVLITVEEKSGDREYTTKVPRMLKGGVDAMKWADEKIAKTWLDDDDAEETDKGYSFEGGQYLVHISEIKIITKEEFEVLAKYL